LRFVFLDTEFTGEHGKTTLVSLAMVTMDGQTLEINFNDYNKKQVSSWLKKNVLSNLKGKSAYSSKTAFIKISNFLENYSSGEKIIIVTAGKTLDLTLLFDLYQHSKIKNKNSQFHWLHDLPDYLSHNDHLDLMTMFFLAGLKNINRENFANLKIKNNKHNALYDAIIVRKCFNKLLSKFPRLKKHFKK
jgi:DNA polymerase III epsilon subunit-like protein